MIDEILMNNKRFVANEEYKQYETSKYPDRKLAIVTCMDTRLTELLPAALGLKNGDAKLIKSAGGVISHPFGSVVRSLLIAIYELGVEDIMVIGHTDCGVQHMHSEQMLETMLQRGVSSEIVNMMSYCGIDFTAWLSGFDHVEMAVQKSVETLRQHPLLPKDIAIYGYVINSLTGELTPVDNIYK